MAPPTQKAAWRPISFVLHDTATGALPVVVPLSIRPEDLTRTETSRLTATQTLGGAWADNFGPAIPTVQIAGHTGWGAGGRQDGLSAFQNLHARVFTGWHLARANAAASGLDPDKVRLIFCDGLDGFTWLVAPQNFVLKRNKTRPLLAQYQISLLWLDDVMSDGGGALSGLFDGLFGSFLGSVSGILSKSRSLGTLTSAIGALRGVLDGQVGNLLGSFGEPFDGFTNLAEQALTKALETIEGGSVTSGSTAGAVVSLASDLARGGANAMSMIQTAVGDMTLSAKADLQQAGSALGTAATLLDGALKPERYMTDYSGLYGSALSSLSAENPFPYYLSSDPRGVSMTPQAWSALSALKSADPVLAPAPLNNIGLNMAAIAAGTTLNG